MGCCLYGIVFENKPKGKKNPTILGCSPFPSKAG